MPKHAAIRGPKPLHTPHDRNKVINRAPSPKWVANFRELIRCNDLITRLQTFSLADPDDPTSPRMTRTQAQVALSLLRKVLPDMQSLEVRGNTDAPITVSVLRFSDALDPPTITLQATEPTPQTALQNGTTLMHDELLQPLTIDAQARLIDDDPQPISQRRAKRPQSNQ